MSRVCLDALGIAEKGKAHELVANGDITYGGKYLVNPSGGLISKGHPIGATGLAQASELVHSCQAMSDTGVASSWLGNESC
jgi:sterol carrier protein 2